MGRQPTGNVNVVIVSFKNERDAREALISLRELDKANHVDVVEAGVIERTVMGWVSLKVEAERDEGFIDRLKDALDGPDAVTEADKAAAVAFIGRQVPQGSFAVIALVGERAGEATIDQVMAQRGATVARRPAIDVFTELEEIREENERRAGIRARAQEKLDELLEKRR